MEAWEQNIVAAGVKQLPGAPQQTPVATPDWEQNILSAGIKPVANAPAITSAPLKNVKPEEYYIPVNASPQQLRDFAISQGFNPDKIERSNVYNFQDASRYNSTETGAETTMGKWLSGSDTMRGVVKAAGQYKDAVATIWRDENDIEGAKFHQALTRSIDAQRVNQGKYNDPTTGEYKPPTGEVVGEYGTKAVGTGAALVAAIPVMAMQRMVPYLGGAGAGAAAGAIIGGGMNPETMRESAATGANVGMTLGGLASAAPTIAKAGAAAAKSDIFPLLLEYNVPGAGLAMKGVSIAAQLAKGAGASSARLKSIIGY